MTLQQLEKAVSELPPDQLSQFREWLLAFDADRWDRQLDADLTAGKLDRIADEAIRQHQQSESTGL